MERFVDTRYEFTPVEGVKAFYGLRIVRDGDQMAVVLTELPENPGISVTNAAEEIATQVRREFGLDPDQTRWIEHYTERQNRIRGVVHIKAATHDEVVFNWENYQASEPNWRRLRQEEVESLLGVDESKPLFSE